MDRKRVTFSIHSNGNGGKIMKNEKIEIFKKNLEGHFSTEFIQLALNYSQLTPPYLYINIIALIIQ